MTSRAGHAEDVLCRQQLGQTPSEFATKDRQNICYIILSHAKK